jgi:hypothetical protein
LGLVLFAESILNSLRPNCVLERVENSSRVRVVIRTFRVIPQHNENKSTCASVSDHRARKQNGRP